MLCNREDAEDATQEILVRIITRLTQFDFHSKLKTWAFRVAVNYILDVKKSAVERLPLSFESFAQDLSDGLGMAAPDETEHSLLIEEVKVSCSLGMLQCLDRPPRLAYVLGEIFEMFVISTGARCRQASRRSAPRLCHPLFQPVVACQCFLEQRSVSGLCRRRARTRRAQNHHSGIRRIALARTSDADGGVCAGGRNYS
jgi:DNA-directed RNA polymerase specialized sigma24 family protein